MRASSGDTQWLGDHVDIGFVQSLVDLDMIKEYNWGGAFIASMYHDISLYSHRVRTGLGSSASIWEAWAYLCFAFTTPTLTREVPWEILVMSHFSSIMFLETPLEGNLLRAWELSNSEVLLRCRTIRCYFLSERVYVQMTGLLWIPANPPVDMLCNTHRPILRDPTADATFGAGGTVLTDIKII
ncbi:hypothetical protein JCGZ_04926 [Jatropha curcas]|uniref:Aminotransferase-like plant mobile domain-containing protein n=1 Tax=Jatropha curcas TaxID=180498 RepID=A0A067KUH5_JATCU|nr:hypothetical protein JCGZ_04926 [Jatropha curcas]